MAYSVINKDCTINGYGFAHELGHNFGNRHNIERYDSTEDHLEHAHGFLIPEDHSVPNRHPGDPRWDGYNTIMAYWDYNYYNSINCWSNPEVSFTYKGISYVTGDATYANAARVLTEKRVAMSLCGDETIICSSGTGTTPATTTKGTTKGITTTTTTTKTTATTT